MRKRILHGFDWLLFLAALALVGIGLIMIYSTYEANLSDGSDLL